MNLIGTDQIYQIRITRAIIQQLSFWSGINRYALRKEAIAEKLLAIGTQIAIEIGQPIDNSSLQCGSVDIVVFQSNRYLSEYGDSGIGSP